MRRRPNQHIRRIRTRYGRKRVLVNRGVLSRKKKYVMIHPPERRVFSQLSDSKVHRKEYGGAIDFKKDGNIERIDVHSGKPSSLEFYSGDYEVFYHTHPFKEDYPPSPEDIFALVKDKPQKAEIVFQNGEAFTVTKTRRTKQLEKMPNRKLSDLLVNLYTDSHGPGWKQKYRKGLEEMGFAVAIHKNKKRPIRLNITPVEPRGASNVRK